MALTGASSLFCRCSWTWSNVKRRGRIDKFSMAVSYKQLKFHFSFRWGYQFAIWDWEKSFIFFKMFLRQKVKMQPFASTALVENAFCLYIGTATELNSTKFTNVSMSLRKHLRLAWWPYYQQQYDCVKNCLLKLELELEEKEADKTVIKPFLFAHWDRDIHLGYCVLKHLSTFMIILLYVVWLMKIYDLGKY